MQVEGKLLKCLQLGRVVEQACHEASQHVLQRCDDEVGQKMRHAGRYKTRTYTYGGISSILQRVCASTVSD